MKKVKEIVLAPLFTKEELEAHSTRVKEVLEDLKKKPIGDVLDYSSKPEAPSTDFENEDFLKKTEGLMRSPSSNSLGSASSRLNRSVHSAGSKHSNRKPSGIST